MTKEGDGVLAASEPITVVHGAMAVPARNGSEATVCDAFGAPVVDAGIFRRSRYIPAEFVDRSIVEPHTVMSGTYLFGGVFWMHFGHFLFETISRLWAVPLVRDKLDGVVFFRGHGHRSPPEAFLTILKHLGIDLPIIFVDQPMGFERLIVPRSGCGMGPLSAGTPVFRDFVRRQFGVVSPRVGMERIYLTREGYRLRRGGIFAESHLRQLLEAEGYVAFAPERHSFEQQLSTYLGATHIIGPDSSALHLVGFVSPPDAEVAILLRRHEGAHDILPQLTGFMGRKPLVVDAILRLFRRDNERNENWSMFAELDFPKVRDALVGAGFMEGKADWSRLGWMQRQRGIASYEKKLQARIQTIWAKGRAIEPVASGTDAPD